MRMVGICEDVSREILLEANLDRTAERLAIAQNLSAVTFDWDLKTTRLPGAGKDAEVPTKRKQHWTTTSKVRAHVTSDPSAAVQGFG